MADESKEYMPKLRFKSPKPWNSYSLDGIFEFKKNATNSREDLTEEGNLYYIHYGDIHTKYDGFIDFSKDNIPYLKENIPVKADFIYNGDIIIADASEDEEGIGKTVEVSNLSGDKKAISGLHTVVLRPHKNIFSPFFASYLFSSGRIKKQFLKIATGMKVYSLAKSALKGVNLVFPALAEQQKIADCLSSLDELIEAHEQKRDALVEHKKGLMQRLFPAEGENTPRWRFPEFRKAEEWEEKSLGEICKTFSGGTPSTSNKAYYGGSIPFIRSAEINNTKTELFLTELGLENSSAKLVKEGDILLALYGANSGEVAISKMSGAINQAILCLRSTQNNFFIFHYLFFKKDYFISKYLQGGQGNFSAEIVKAISIPLPALPEQQKIADCLSSLDARIEAEEAEIASLRVHKQGLMQQLFPQNL